MRKSTYYLGGALTLIVLALLLRDSFSLDVNVDVAIQQRAEERSARRPMPRSPQPTIETFVVDDSEQMGSRTGTAFAVERSGVWVTAAHVTRACDRVGLAHSDDVRSVSRVIESPRDDVTVMVGGLPAVQTLHISDEVLPIGSVAYHMGFPNGQPAVIVSQLLGTTSTLHRNHEETQLVWVEGRRMPEFDGELGGASGGPVLAANGAVVGVISASTPRRGRILTVAPEAILTMMAANAGAGAPAAPTPIRSPEEALDRFIHYLATGVIREVHCEVA